MSVITEWEAYGAQRARWPAEGRHVLAHHDDESLVVYQAFRPAIAEWALEHQRFGGPAYSFGRMSWIKPNFLWMMYRSGWATKEGQEYVLALRIPRAFFDGLLEAAVPSSHDRDRYPDAAEWKRAVKHSEVRLQWDPDHDPNGEKVARRAIQIGLRGETLEAFATHEALVVDDMTPRVIAARDAGAKGWDEVELPLERVYRPSAAIAERLRLD